MASSTTGKWKSKDEFERQKRIEEMRKAGTLEPEQDEEGRDINPHIPQYISRVPWYVDKGAPSLKHQRSISDKNTDELSKWYQKGARKAEVVTKYRDGACENCGALTHKTKECTERPRRRGAKLTGVGLQRDEVVENINLSSYDAKRDRWNGYDPNEYKQHIEKFTLLEQERRKIKSDELNKKILEKKAKEESKQQDSTGDQKQENVESDSDTSDSDLDEDKEEMGGAATVVSKGDKRTQSIRNLRIREDRAKYLIKLEGDAHYDPKTRSMRENPDPNGDSDTTFKGDNYLRYSGDYSKFLELQKYAYDAEAKGQDINIAATPSQTELLYKNYVKKKESLQNSIKSAILDRYGGVEHLQRSENLVKEFGAQSEAYVEYGRSGQIVRNLKKSIPKSKYEEDVFVNGHTSIWGSFYDMENKKWGYSCCKSTNRGSPCSLVQGGATLPPVTVSVPEENKTDQTDENKNTVSKEQDSIQQRLMAALLKKKEKALQQENAEAQQQENSEKEEGKKRSHSESKETDEASVAEKEMEEYHQKRARYEDPMKDFL